MRLGCGAISNAALAKRIREKYPDAAISPDAGHYDVMAWFIGICPPPNRREAAAPKPKHVHQQDLRVGDEFLRSFEWRKLRMEVIVERGARCECCGASPKNGHSVINVDHIKPRRLFPDLALIKSNLQVLCDSCNQGKGNWDMTDWRGAEPQSLRDDQPKRGKAVFDDRPRLVK